MVKKDKGVNRGDNVKEVKKTDVLKKTRSNKEIELYDLETGNADLEYTRKFNSVVDSDFNVLQKNSSKKNVSSKKRTNVKKRRVKFSTNDIKVLICGVFYLVSFVLLILGVIRYANHASIKECSNYFITVLFLVIVATILISIEISNKNVKTLLGFSITSKISKKRRVREYFKESILIALIATTFIAMYIATGDLFIDFYKLTGNVCVNVIIFFILMYIVALVLAYTLCYFYSEHKISKK